MFVHTDIPEAPWFTAESEDKKRSRINVIKPFPIKHSL
jgi:polyphosphate kinase 2 (PPK2 family)